MKQDTSFHVHCYTTSPLRKPQHDVSFPSKQCVSYTLMDCNLPLRWRSDMLIKRIQIFKFPIRIQIYLTHYIVNIFDLNKILSQALQISATHSGDIHRLYPFMFLFFLARMSSVVQGLLIFELSKPHTMTHHSRYYSSGRVISPTRKPLRDNTQHS